MARGPCLSEQRMTMLASARRWFDARGTRCKVDLQMTAPIPRYQLSTSRAWLTADQVIAEARNYGWQP